MPPKGAESSFLDFLESYSEYTSYEEEKGRYVKFVGEGITDISPKETLYNMWKGAGSPYVTNYSPEELLSQDKSRGIKTYDEDPRAFYSMGGRTMWDVAGMWEKGREVSPDTLHIQRGNLEELFAELAHSEQYKDKWYPGRGEIKNILAGKKYGEKVYDVEYLEDIEPMKGIETSYFTGRRFPKSKTKSVEYEAHREIQPELESRFRKTFKASWE